MIVSYLFNDDQIVMYIKMISCVEKLVSICSICIICIFVSVFCITLVYLCSCSSLVLQTRFQEKRKLVGRRVLDVLGQVLSCGSDSLFWRDVG